MYSMFTIWKSDGIGNDHNLHRGENCMKKFCESLREHTIKLINFEKKKMIALKKIQNIFSSNNQKKLKELVKI